jgi:hypothetical protein
LLHLGSINTPQGFSIQSDPIRTSGIIVNTPLMAKFYKTRLFIIDFKVKDFPKKTRKFFSGYCDFQKL